MNKPAPKEPSMDEILSSIRQIIADDDAGAVPRRPAAPPAQPAAVPRTFAPAPSRPADVPPPAESAEEPLALSPEQILRDTAAEDESRPGLSFNELIGEASPPELSLVDPEDVAFDGDDGEEEPIAAAPPEPAPAARMPPAAFQRPAPAARTAMPVSQAAPLPDPTLTRDMAEQLLEPATQSAVKSTFSRLSGLSTIGSGITIEQMMREMLRPMLKEWLDENLPSIVERMVEQEIARVSRGGR